MIDELAFSEIADLVVNAVGRAVNETKSAREWKKIFINTGKFFCDYEKNAERIFDDLAIALSSENMKAFAEELKSENGYELKEKIFAYIHRILIQYDIPEDVALSYAAGISSAILNEIKIVKPEIYDRYFQKDWREEDRAYLESLSQKIEKINTALAMFKERQMKVFSANDKDIELKRKTYNPRIGIDFFEIDDEAFKSAFAEQLHNNKICVKGRFVEETLYCILNEIWKNQDTRAVFVVQSEEDWTRLGQIAQSDNIYIPNFIADEIVPIENNTNIFIYTEDIPAFSNELIELRPRTYATISNCLVRAGMDLNDANTLVAETHGLYVAMKKKLFNGQLLKQPEWLTKLAVKIQKTCLLLGQWTECEGDITVVETLSGIPYDEFVEELTKYSKGEDPFIHIVNRRGSKSYYLSSVENTWEYLQVSVTEDVWKTFADLFLDVLNEHEKIFTYGQKELLMAQFTGERLFWSSTIRKGMLKTLLIKAGYKKHEECQKYLDSIIENILSYVDTPGKWKYISEFFIELCEIAPKVILKRLYAELDNSTGLISLFENQDSDFIMGKNHYISILFGVDEFLLQKKYAQDAFIWLMKLDDKGLKYESNCPGDAFAKVLCTWHNFSVFRTSTEKIRLAEMAFEYNNNTWNVIYKSLPGNQRTIMGTLHAPKYRECVQDGPVTRETLNNTVVGYINILLKHMDFRPERWEKLIKYSEDVDKSIRNKIFESFLREITQMNDAEIIEVKDSIRKLIYRHRYFASASWAMPEAEVLEYEKLLDDIHSSEPEYEYLYLFKPRHEKPLLRPVPYDEDDKMEANEAAVEMLLQEKVAEIKANNYDLTLLAKLCAQIDDSSLGQVLAKYWDGDCFDIDVFTILVKAQKFKKYAGMALDYYSGFGNQITELFDEVMGVALSLDSEQNVLTGLYRVEAWWSNSIPRIAEAEETIKHDFWKYEYVRIGGNPKWGLDECKRYGTLNSYLHLLYFTHHNNPLPNEELYERLDGIENLERNINGRDFQFYIEELLKPLQKAYIYDSVKSIRIATLEMVFFQFLEWENMKCFKHSINQEPKVYADLVNIVFRKDHAENEEHTEKEKNLISNLYDLYHKAEFCPAEIDGEVDQESLENWILKFKMILEENDQSSLLGRILGRLFSFSPVGLDEHMPCEAVRIMIEQYSDGSLQQEYRTTVINSRGVFILSAGKEERRMAESFRANAEYMASKGYTRTAEIYYSLARSYFAEAAIEREDAENGRFS